MSPSDAIALKFGLIVFGAYFALIGSVGYAFARRLHTLDPELTISSYWWRIGAALGYMAVVIAPLGTHQLTRKPNGKPIHEAFVRYTWITAGIVFAYLCALIFIGPAFLRLLRTYSAE